MDSVDGGLLANASICVVVPAYRVRHKVLDVLGGMPHYVRYIYVVDDACPERSGDHVEQSCSDPRVKVLRHDVNQGVGGAVMTGYRQGLEDGAEILVKVDGDGQMNPALIAGFVIPIMNRHADYTKGNRFYNLSELTNMPLVRLFGNSALSFFSKMSTGYWNLFDPTNGFTAIHRVALSNLPMDSISRRYFFETDMLFRLNIIRAKVKDVPMDSVYGDETSSLRVSKILPEFMVKHARIFAKRIFYNYFLRDFSIASAELIAGMLLLTFGIIFGGSEWMRSVSTGVPSTSGSVMISALPVILGFQLLLAFLAYDISNVPREALSEDYAN